MRSKTKSRKPKAKPTLAETLVAGVKAEAKAEDKKKAAGHWLQESTSTQQHIDSLSTRIRTLEQLLAKAEVDLDVWDVERYVTNQWEMGARLPDGRVAVTPLYQIKAWLKKKGARWSQDDFRKALIADISKTAPKYSPIARRSKSGLMYEVSVFDHHVGKLAWMPETGSNYDLAIARHDYMAAVEDLLERIKEPIDLILFPVGNDFLHTDNLAGTTTKGTPQDCDGRWAKMFTTGSHLLISSIERMRQLAPVEVMVIPGNHDRERMFYVGEVLSARFHGAKDVKVLNEPKPRKYKAFGVNLIGFTHGCDEKETELPRLMADEVPELWAKAKFREWHTAHQHKRKEVRWVSTDTHGKTVVRRLPSLSGTDSWHYGKGYVGNRASEAYLWSKEDGYLAHFSHSPKDTA